MSSEPAPSPSGSSSSLSTDEKVEKAKELIEKKREQKLLEEKEVQYRLITHSFF